MRKFAFLLPLVLVATILLPCCISCKQKGNVAGEEQPQYIVGAFLWEANPDDIFLEGDCFTHLNYAFGEISASGDSLVIPSPRLFRRCLDLRHDNPGLKVLLSLQSEPTRFSEMAADTVKRATFIAAIKHAVDIYDIDGIDIDWEFPTYTMPEDSTNYVAMVAEMRQALGNDKIISVDGGADLAGLVIPKLLPLVDYFNVMAYDLGWAPNLHTPLHRSEHTGWLCVDEVVETYERAGIPRNKMVLGMGFYGRGDGVTYKGWTEYNETKVLPGFTERWDSVACVPYIADENDVVQLGFENPRSIAIKCEYIKDGGFLGGMYWRYAYDDSIGTMRHTVARHLMPGYKK